ncbi:MAG: tetratricopeptide repeat protein [Ignavibacteriales bacterium]|nr:tetratricopeptide repeat protein [Ignavibacteriales bacterium]
MQIFWGYLEIYSVVLLLISSFLLLSVLVIQEKVRFYWLLPAYTLLVLSHFLNLLLGLSVLLLCLNEWRKNGPRQLFLGMGISLLIFLSVFAIAGFDCSFLFHSFTRTHILSINKTIDEFQAYTLFSGYHFLDLLNLLILLGPVVIFLLLITMRRLVWKEGNNTFKWFFLLYMLPLFLAFFIIKFDLSMAKDWDIAATFFWIATVGALYYFGISTYSEKIKPLVLLLGTTVLVSIGWFQVNANEESSINRMKGIMDGPFMQRGAYYLSAFDLSMHFFHTGKVEQLVPIWKKYLKLYPEDHRGYEKLVKSYWELGESGYDSISATYERWMKMEPNSSDAKSSYANFCLYVGSTFMNAGNQEKATSYFQKCTTLNPNLPGPYNNLGLIYYSRNEFDEAMKLFQKAIQVNPQYARSYKNIADIHLQKESKKPSKHTVMPHVPAVHTLN